MFCTQCGKDIAGGSCASCPATIVAPTAASNRPTPFKEALPRILLGCFLGALFSIKFSLFGGINWPYSVGTFIGILIFPTLIAYAARGRQRNWKSFGTWFAVGIVIVAWMSKIGNARKHETDEQQVARVMREALGIEKPSSISDSEEDVLRGIFRDFFATAGKVQAGYRDVHLDASYQPDSFANESAMRAEIAQLDKLLEVNRNAHQMFSTFPEFAERRLVDYGVGQKPRTRFLEQMTNSMNSSGAVAFDFLAKEQRWAQTTKSLYEFAQANQDVISVKDGKVRIGDAEVLKKFNELWRVSADAQEDMDKARDAKDKTARAGVEKFGLKTEEVQKGLENQR